MEKIGRISYLLLFIWLQSTLYLATVKLQDTQVLPASQSVYWLYPKYMFNWTLVSMKRLKKTLTSFLYGEEPPWGLGVLH